MKYYLKESFNLVCMGKDNEVEFIEIPAPTGGIIECSILQAEANKIIVKSKEEREKGEQPKEGEESKEVEKLTGYQAYMMMIVADADMIKCYDAVKQCIVKSKSFINGDTSFRCSASIYDQLPYKEISGMLGEYLANFFVSFLLEPND